MVQIPIKSQRNGIHFTKPVHLAMWYFNNIEYIKYITSIKEATNVLLQEGAEINAEGDSKLTPCHVSAANGKKDCLALLIKAGFNIYYICP
jgi:ankyrin repeat protein